MSSKFQGRVDPLDILRTFITQKKKIKLREDSLYFDNVKLKLNTETPWLSHKTNKRYDLGSLWLFLDCDQREVVNVNYPEKTSELNVQYINAGDREEILNYFHGKIDSTPSINQKLKMEIAQSQFKKDAQKADGVEDPGARKKVKEETETDHHLRVLEWLSHFSKPVASKNKVLKAGDKSFEDIIKFVRNGDPKSASKPTGRTRIATIYDKKKQPIIIVPEVSQPGNVCMKNIRKLLENGEYAEASQCPDIPMRKIEISRNLRGKTIFFDITNNPSLLTPLEWDCVIAIFVLGRQTQFSSWPDSNVSKIFSKHKGFLLKYNDSKLAEAKDWNVKVISIQKLTRYEDADVHKFIWNQIEKILFSPVE